jgi:hypothetical protein
MSRGPFTVLLVVAMSGCGDGGLFTLPTAPSDLTSGITIYEHWNYQGSYTDLRGYDRTEVAATAPSAELPGRQPKPMPGHRSTRGSSSLFRVHIRIEVVDDPRVRIFLREGADDRLPIRGEAARPPLQIPARKRADRIYA